MKRPAALLLILLLLASCAPSEQPVEDIWAYISTPIPAVEEGAAVPALTAAMVRELPVLPAVFEPYQPLAPRETVEAYLELQYLSYLYMKPVDLGAIVDMTRSHNRNAQVWLETLIQRRRLLLEHQLCYVETERLDYTVTYLDQPDDQRMSFWEERGGAGEEELVLHFAITGEPGRAYPPMFALNAQHTVRLAETEEGWKITYHYYPGSVRKYRRSATLAVPPEEAMLAELLREFAPAASPLPSPLPQGARAYDGEAAVAYALRHTESSNPAFYNIGDWMGNCANFISQCVWHGFSGGEAASVANRANMTSLWYAGEGGGAPPWENVNHFWSYITGEGSALRGQVLSGVTAMEPGDVLQTKSGGSNDGDEDSFNHSMILVDGDTLMLAQNSPACYVYYADLVGVETRFVRPVSLIPGG